MIKLIGKHIDKVLYVSETAAFVLLIIYFVAYKVTKPL